MMRTKQYGSADDGEGEQGHTRRRIARGKEGGDGDDDDDGGGSGEHVKGRDESGGKEKAGENAGEDESDCSCGQECEGDGLDLEMGLQLPRLGQKRVRLSFVDRTNFVKLSSDGWEVRNDEASFGSIRSNCYVSGYDSDGGACQEHMWYYEATLRTGGIVQIGWATKDSVFKPEEGAGVGDDHFSYAYDGCRRQVWHAGVSYPCGRRDTRWKAGDVVSCLFDARSGVISFMLNGRFISALGSRTFTGVRTNLAFYPALSLSAFQQCTVNFGQEQFRFKPIGYRSVNDFATLYNIPLEEEASPAAGALALVLPSSSFSCTRSHAEDEDEDEEGLCRICYAQQMDARLLPCGHQEICYACSIRLTVCPVCRSLIDDRKLLSGGASGERPTKEEREKEGEDAMMEICA